jgi:hypothetical protein
MWNRIRTFVAGWWNNNSAHLRFVAKWVFRAIVTCIVLLSALILIDSWRNSGSVANGQEVNVPIKKKLEPDSNVLALPTVELSPGLKEVRGEISELSGLIKVLAGKVESIPAPDPKLNPELKEVRGKVNELTDLIEALAKRVDVPVEPNISVEIPGEVVSLMASLGELLSRKMAVGEINDVNGSSLGSMVSAPIWETDRTWKLNSFETERVELFKLLDKLKGDISVLVLKIKDREKYLSDLKSVLDQSVGREYFRIKGVKYSRTQYLSEAESVDLLIARIRLEVRAKEAEIVSIGEKLKMVEVKMREAFDEERASLVEPVVEPNVSDVNEVLVDPAVPEPNVVEVVDPNYSQILADVNEVSAFVRERFETGDVNDNELRAAFCVLQDAVLNLSEKTSKK